MREKKYPLPSLVGPVGKNSSRPPPSPPLTDLPPTLSPTASFGWGRRGVDRGGGCSVHPDPITLSLKTTALSQGRRLTKVTTNTLLPSAAFHKARDMPLLPPGVLGQVYSLITDASAFHQIYVHAKYAEDTWWTRGLVTTGYIISQVGRVMDFKVDRTFQIPGTDTGHQ